MAQIEDMAMMATVARQNVAHSSLDRGPPRQTNNGIQIALQDGVRAETLAGDIEWHEPVDAHHIGAGIA